MFSSLITESKSRKRTGMALTMRPAMTTLDDCMFISSAGSSNDEGRNRRRGKICRMRHASLLLLLLMIPAPLPAEIHSGGPLGDLYRAQTGGLAHYSSADPTGGNSDRKAIAPGETIVLMNHTGAGVV